jgi:[acyl-carrier-protein] S-malonyltransferase
MSRTVALVFPGQGSQRHGMLDALPDREAVGRLLDAAEALSDLDLRRIAAEGTPEQLSDTRAAQPLLYLADWAWGAALLDAGAAPVAVAGHSLGEFAALAVAGVFSVEAGLELVVERSRLMAMRALATPGGMVAVLGMDGATVTDLVQGISGVWVANDNAPGQIVLSGSHEGLDVAHRLLAEAGARKVVPLAVAGPFHSPLMGPAADAFDDLLDAATFADAAFPVLQNAGPEPATDAATIKARLKLQITSPVRWTETMLELRGMGAGTLVECGPGAVLGGLARRVEGLDALSVEERGIDAVLEEVM